MTESREAYQAAMREAHSLAWALKWEAASQKYRQALAEFPNDPTARLSLAVALSKTGKSVEALQEYLVARELLPRDTLVLTRMAELHLRLGQPAQATQIYLDLANLYIEGEEQQKAVAALREALDHAGGRRRLLQAIKQAVIQAEADELLGRVQMELSQSRPEDPSEEPPAPEPRQAAATPEASAAKAEAKPAAPPRPKAAEPVVALARPRSVAVDPAQCLVDAEQQAADGQAAAAVASYLRASELLTGQRAAAAREAAADLVDNWLPSGLEDALALPPGPRAIVLEAMAASHECLSQGLYLAALDEGIRAVGAGLGYLPAHLRLAEVQRQMGRTEEARQRVAHVVDLYELRREPHRAAMVLREQIALEPGQGEAWQRLIQILLAAGDVDLAADEQFMWARHLLDVGETAAALERQREALRLAPRPDHWLKHGTVLESLGQTEEALAAFDAARELAPNEELVAAAQSRCQAVLERWPAMEANVATVVAAIPIDSVLAEEAIKEYRAALARRGESPALRYCLGMALRAAGHNDEATTHLTKVAEHESRPGRLSRYHLAQWLLAVGQTARAITYLLRVGRPGLVEDEADRALSLASYRLLADAYSQAGDWDGSARALETLLSAGQDDEGLYPRLAEAHFRRGRLAPALAALEQLANLYRARQEPDRAVTIYRGMSQFAPTDPEPKEKLARLFFQLGRREEGLASMDEAVALHMERGREDQAVADLRVMLDACRQHDAQRALALRERLATIRPGDLELRRDLVSAYLKAGRPVRAQAEARGLVDYLLGAGRNEEAVTALQLVIQLDPWNLNEQVRFGNLLGQLGRTEEALATLRRVLERDPANQAASRGISSLLGGKGAQ